MIIVQAPWGADPAMLQALLLAAQRRHDEDTEALVLLPQAEEADGATEEQVGTALSSAAQVCGCFVAASARVVTPDGVRTVGWLVAPDGSILIRQTKILPDLVEGFTDSLAASGAPQPFPVAKTPIGQIGLLLGEDILIPHHARALMFNGAEIILNPSREFADEGLKLRLQARAARAYENHACVACASPLSWSKDGFVERLPAASGLWDEWGRGIGAAGDASFLRAPIQIETLRRRRFEYFGNLSVCIRPTIYARDYTAPGPERAAPSTAEQWKAEAEARVAALAAPASTTIDRYDVVLGQTLSRNVLHPDDLETTVNANIDGALELVRRYAMAPNARLVVFPEFFLQGAGGGGRSKEMWDKVGIRIDGRPIERLGEFAQRHKVYLCGQVLEADDKWPGRVFNTAFILNDSGDLVHRYRKIQCADTFGSFPSTTPGSVLERYLDLYGYEGLFPVCDTPIGRLATVVCFDMNFPETARAVAKRGADLLLHPTAEPYNVRRAAWENARQVRAYENTMYILSAGLGGEFSNPADPLPTLNSRGHSKIVRFDGIVQAVVDGPGPVSLSGQIDLQELRAARARGAANVALWNDASVYRAAYAARQGIPDNLAATPGVNPYVGGKVMRDVIERYAELGVFVTPQGPIVAGAGDAVASAGL